MNNHAGLAPAAAPDSPGGSPGDDPEPAFRLRQPALRVLNGEFGDPPAEWQILDKHRNRIEAYLPSVGRIRQGPFVLGTGVLVARNVVLTARHVAESFSTDIDGTLKIRVGWSPVIDFIGETPIEIADGPDSHTHGTESAPTTSTRAAAQQSPAETTPKPHDHVHQPDSSEPCECCEIRSVLYVDKDHGHDLALLRVAFDDSKGPEVWRRPRPLVLNASDDLIEKKRQVYLIGFPTDDRTATPEEVRTVLGTHFGVKRVQPGRILRLTTGGQDESEFEHDASTLKGNSGSCVIDVETNHLIGLHTRGSREAEGEVSFNRAIAFVRLEPKVQDALRSAGIELSETNRPPSQSA